MTTRYRVTRGGHPRSGSERLLAYVIVGMLEKQGFKAWIDESTKDTTDFIVDIHPDLAIYFIDTMDFGLEYDETVKRISTSS